MLSAKFIEKQKEAILEEKNRLENKIKELKKFPDYGSNEDDNAAELAEYQSNLSLEQQLEFLLKRVNEALVSIEDGTYGKCKKCDKAVEEGRLEIMPYAELCITCSKNSKK